MADSETRQLKLTEVLQIGFVVRDAEKVAEAWSSMFGLGPWSFRYIDGTNAKGRYKGIYHKERLAQTRLGSLNIELVQPVEGKAVHAEFLENVGEGLQHIQVRVDDVEGEAAKLAEQGAEFLLSNQGKVAYMGNLPGGLVLEIVGPRPGDTGQKA